MNHQNNFIPKTLDNLPRFAFWDIYQAMIFLTIFGFGVVMHLLLVGFLLGAFISWGYGRLSSGEGRGFLVHILYWHTNLGSGYEVIPSSDKRYFKG